MQSPWNGPRQASRQDPRQVLRQHSRHVRRHDPRQAPQARPMERPLERSSETPATGVAKRPAARRTAHGLVLRKVPRQVPRQSFTARPYVALCSRFLYFDSAVGPSFLPSCPRPYPPETNSALRSRVYRSTRHSHPIGFRCRGYFLQCFGGCYCPCVLQPGLPRDVLRVLSHCLLWVFPGPCRVVSAGLAAVNIAGLSTSLAAVLAGDCSSRISFYR